MPARRGIFGVVSTVKEAFSLPGEEQKYDMPVQRTENGLDGITRCIDQLEIDGAMSFRTGMAATKIFSRARFQLIRISPAEELNTLMDGRGLWSCLWTLQPVTEQGGAHLQKDTSIVVSVDRQTENTNAC